jgi:hypothetical protein
MSIAKKIRTKIGHMLFMKHLKNMQRDKKVMGFAEAKSIGILYDATDFDDYETVKQYVKDMRAQHKEVLALGYVDRNELHNMQFAKLGLDFFTKKELTWNMIPQHPVVTNFINTPFDILINLHPGKNFPLQYITAMSRSRFRIGIFHKKNEAFFDLLIDVKDDRSLKNFIDQVNHYLKIIRSHDKQTA